MFAPSCVLRSAMVACLTVSALTGCGSKLDPTLEDAKVATSTTGDIDCATPLYFAGHPYTGSGELRREPKLTGRTRSARRPSCPDSPATGHRSEAVTISELAGINVDTAFLADT